jgi:hypothetical protein
MYYICMNCDVGQHLSAVGTHQDKKLNFQMCLVDRKFAGNMRHSIISCFYRRFVSFPHRFVTTGINLLVCGKSMHTNSNNVISLLAMLHVSRTDEMCDVNVIFWRHSDIKRLCDVVMVQVSIVTCVNGDVGQHLSAVGTDHGEKFNFRG